MTRRAGAVLIIVAFSTFSLAQIRVISGIVTDERSHQALGGASVSTVGNQSNPTTTDDGGLFVMQVQTGADSVRIRIEKNGYKVYDKVVPISSVPLQIQLVRTASNKPSNSASSSRHPVTQPEQDLRTRGLNLANEIDAFLTERQRNAPPMNIPPVITSSPSLASKTPPYMAETFNLFAEKFQSRIATIRDELVSQGLKDFNLDIAATRGSRMYGNTDGFIRRITETIRKLVLRLAPQTLYENVSSVDLAKMTLDEASYIERMDNEAIDKMEQSADSDRQDHIRERFQTSFRECCLDQVKNLRGTIIRRLGPSAIDEEEVRQFNDLYDTESFPGNPQASIASAMSYAPKLRSLGEQLQASVSEHVQH